MRRRKRERQTEGKERGGDEWEGNASTTLWRLYQSTQCYDGNITCSSTEDINNSMETAAARTQH